MVSKSPSLPALLDLDATEEQATAYAALLAEACREIEFEAFAYGLDPLDLPNIWLVSLRHGNVVDVAAAAKAIPLWVRIQAWKKAERARNPRYALRQAMTDISERAYHARWNFGTEFEVWDLLQGTRTVWSQFDVADSVDAALLEVVRTASAEAKGWYWWPDGSDGAVFIPLDQWLQIYADAPEPC